MSQRSSQVASGNIAPTVMGPARDTKEVIILGGVVLFMGGLLATAWLYSQIGDQVTASPATEKADNASVPGLLMKSSALHQTGTSSTHPTQITTPALSTPEVLHADIYFEVGRKGLTDEGKTQLAAHADMLKQHQDYGVLIQGYTDQQGSASYNKLLGVKRAETVKAELLNAGVAEHQMKTVSLGEEGVLCVDSSNVCRHMNRRVHLEVRKIGQEHMMVPPAPTTPSDSPETTIDSSSTMGENGTTGESLPPSWSEPALIPKPTKGR